MARFLKKKGRGPVEPGEADENGPEWKSADAEWTDEFNARILDMAMERARPHFEPMTWRAFEGVWLENRRAGDVAAELKQPIEVIYTSKSRVLKRLEEEVRILAEDVPQLVPLS